MFLRLLRAALASGRAHVADPHGGAPPHARAWGWKGQTRFSGNGLDDTIEQIEWQPQGRRVGWVDGEDLYLEPEASYAEAQRLAGEQGESLAVTSETLRRRLNQKGLLVTREDRRQKLTVRVNLEGVRRTVLHLYAESVSPTPETGPTGPRGKKINSANGSLLGAGSGATNGKPAPEPAHKPAQAGRDPVPQ
jgi:hypothetical protein